MSDAAAASAAEVRPTLKEAAANVYRGAPDADQGAEEEASEVVTELDEPEPDSAEAFPQPADPNDLEVPAILRRRTEQPQ